MDGAGELEKAYREEATRIRAALAARLGDVGLAKELVQDAFIEAIEHWRAEGTPPNPGGLAGHHGAAQSDRPAPPGTRRTGKARAPGRDRDAAG